MEGAENSWLSAGGARGPLQPAVFHSGGPVLTVYCLLSGSPEERGLLAWNQIQESSETTKVLEIYGFPCRIGTQACASSWTRCLPFWPRLEGSGKEEVGMSQLTLCSQDPSGEPPKGAAETGIEAVSPDTHL